VTLKPALIVPLGAEPQVINATLTHHLMKLVKKLAFYLHIKAKMLNAI